MLYGNFCDVIKVDTVHMHRLSAPHVQYFIWNFPIHIPIISEKFPNYSTTYSHSKPILQNNKNETAKNTTSPHNTKECHTLRLLNCNITGVSIKSWILEFWVSEKDRFSTKNTLSAAGCITASLQAAVDQSGSVLLWFFQNLQTSWDESTSSHAAMLMVTQSSNVAIRQCQRMEKQQDYQQLEYQYSSLELLKAEHVRL